MITMNKRTARAAGYRPLTGDYQLPDEQRMLDGVLADMRRGDIDHVLVKARRGVSVWRTLRPATARSETIRTARSRDGIGLRANVRTAMRRAA